jgi:hypothetical protein
VAVNFRRITLGVIVIFLTSALIPPGSASELSDAEKAHGELRAEYGQYFETLNSISAQESTAQECVTKYADSNVASQVTQRNDCQATLNRLQSERSAILDREQVAKGKILELEQLIERLKTAAVSSGTAPAGGSSSSSSGITPLIQNETPKPASEPQTTQSSSQPEPVTKESQPVDATQVPAPVQSPAAAQNQNSVSSATPVVTNKVTPSPKPKAKKKTITCTKGKVSRKVTAVKPVCPKGFKIKAKK